jgi:polysaccharide biosynthesis transport protein
MMYRDDPSSKPTPDSQQATVGSPLPPGESLVVQSNGAAHHHPIAFPMQPAQPPQDVLRGGMDANTFLHSLRRRWLLAMCIGGLAAVGAGALLWYSFPESASATALFQVSPQQQSIVFDVNKNNTQSFDTLKKTQLALLRANFVLSAAVRNPGIASLSVFAGERLTPEEWLQNNLRVDFPQQGEILSITISDDAPPGELVRLVDAVAKAYRDEVIYEERQRRLMTRDLLARSLDKLKKDMESRWTEYLNMAKDAGRSASEQDPETDLLLAKISGLLKQKNDLESQLYQTQTNFAVMKQRLEDPAMIEAQVDQMLAQDPTMAMLNQQLMYHQMQLQQAANIARRGNSPTTVGHQRRIQQIQSQISQHRQQAKAQYMGASQGAPNATLQSITKESQILAGMLRARHQQTDKALQEAMKEMQDRTGISIELESRKSDLEQLQQISNDMSIKLQSLDIEASAPEQIRQIQPAVPSQGLNKAQRYTIATMGALAAFALSCFGIGYLEFRNRRLNGPDQMDEGLGIRVVGTLPSLASRQALDAAHPIVAQLTESIDSVRTILMHDSTSMRRQVVLVTSAATMEGRTTVASQLAASLARAGRRTLLIDGDLRRPALHALFDVPLEDGLCEVLRAEVDVDDVIRPTHAEGLWLLTAGYCDVDAIQALATEQMQPVFDKLRREYDFIIIDGAPVVGMSDALIFGQYSDGAILSVRRDHSQMPKINQAAELLRDVGIRIIGAVVNGVPAKADDRIVALRLIAPKAERELQPTG